MTNRKQTDEGQAHDVLAAEAFAVPSADPALEPAHDILAAESFEVPGYDPDLHERHEHQALHVPRDPHGEGPPHDVLAAEEFPMPALRPHPTPGLVERRGGVVRFALEIAVAVSALIALRRVMKRPRGR